MFSVEPLGFGFAKRRNLGFFGLFLDRGRLRPEKRSDNME